MKIKIPKPTLWVLVAVIIILLGGGFYFGQRFYQKGTKALSPLLTPEKVAENFYQWYIDCLDKRQGECPWEKSEYVSEKLRQNIRGGQYDPIICAQNTPNLSEGTLTLEPAKILGNTATVTVRDFYSWKNRPVDVELELISNQWKIMALACPPSLTPDQVAGEFYTWYINCRGGKVKGPLSPSGYCPFEEKYESVELFKKIAENYGSEELVQKIEWGPGADPILCAQDLPPAITVGEPETIGKNAKVTITEEFTPPIKIQVDLRLTRSYESRNWEVANITCPK